MLNRGQTFDAFSFYFMWRIFPLLRGILYKNVLKNYFIQLSLHFSPSNELLPLKSLLAQVNLTNAAGSNYGTPLFESTPRILQKFSEEKI